MNSSKPEHPAPAIYLVILGINALVFMILVAKGADPIWPDWRQMIAWGANYAPATLNGQPWRLFTSMFLHLGVIHLVANGYMLVVLGRIVEWDFGSLRFTLIYLLSGLFGSLASALLVTATDIKVSAGASGALMGIAGACLAHGLVSYLRNKQGLADSLIVPLILTISLNLAFGALVDGVDNACHIGGLLAGGVLGGIFAVTRFENSALKRYSVTAMVTLVSLSLLFYAVKPVHHPYWQLVTRLLGA